MIPQKKIKRIAVLVLIGILAIIALTGLYRVEQGEQAVVLTFGRLTDTKEPGLYWHIPMIQEIRKQSKTQIYTLEYGFRTETTATSTSIATYSDVESESMILTGDQNIVKVEAVYQVYVNDVASFFYNVDDPFGTMQVAFETVLRRNIQDRTLDDALLNKQDIESQVIPDFRAMLQSYNLGVTLKEVRIQNIMVPQQVSSAYEDVNNAKNEKTRKIDEAEKYKNEVVPNARAQAYKMIQEAEAYKAQTVAKALGEVAEFNNVFAKYINSMDITRKRLLIETLETILANANKLYIVDDSSGTLKLLDLADDAASGATSPSTGG
ncbi:MAG: FtsH protease activity modulator HflK [Christensenellales bacterium]